jgi:imidazolonepropionase-like amidohydrolase
MNETTTLGERGKGETVAQAKSPSLRRSNSTEEGNRFPTTSHDGALLPFPFLRGFAVVVLALVAFDASADETSGAQIVLRVGTLHVGDGKTIKDALIVVESGKFSVVGAGEAPPHAVVREFRDAQAAPGFVDGFTRLGVQGGAAEDVEVLTPQVRAADAFDARSPELRGLVEYGTTTIGIGPAAANIAAGRAAVVRLGGDGATFTQTAGPPTFSFIAPAIRPDRVPATFAGARRLLASAFAGERWREPGEPDVPLRAESILAMRDMPAGPALAWADTPTCATTAVEVLRAKKLDVTLLGVRGCAANPDALAALGAPCVVTGLRPEDPLALLALPGRLHAKGVAVAISTSAPDRSARSLRLALSLAVAAGLPADAAVAAVTSAPAKMLGVGGRVGLVAPKFDADLVVFDGAPWDVRSRVLLVVSGGEVAFEAKR